MKKNHVVKLTAIKTVFMNREETKALPPAKRESEWEDQIAHIRKLEKLLAGAKMIKVKST